MKICLIAPWSYKLFHPFDKRISSFGGAEVQQYQLGKELAKDSDFEVNFIVGNFFQKQPKTEKIQIGERKISLYKAVKCYKRIFFTDTIWDYWNLFHTMKTIKADIYLIRGGGSLAGTVAFLAKKVFKKFFIYSSAHDRDSNLDFLKKHPWYINTLFQYALKKADLIICQHVEQKKAFKKNFGLESKVIKSIYPMESKVNGKKRKYILWVSRLEVWKQSEIFSKLAQKFPEEKFLLITNSETADFRSKFGNIRNLEIQEKVPFEYMDDYFKKAKVFVNTSLHEGFPNTFVQASKNKTPILSLNVNPEGILEKYGMGKCAYGSFEKLANNLAKILGNEILWQQMAKNAYNYAKENHDTNKIVHNYKSILQSFKK